MICNDCGTWHTLHLSRRNALVAKNVGLVYAVVRSVGVEPSAAVYDDCVQEGMIGLCKAAERFDPKRGVAFSTFAWLRIQGEVKACLCKTSVVSEPVKKVSKRAAENARGQGAEPTRAPVVDTSARALPECLIDRDGEDALLERIDTERRHEALDEAVDELPDDERDVMRAALQGSSISGYARGHGCGREHVSALLRSATASVTGWFTPKPKPPPRKPLAPVGWVQLVFSFMLFRAPSQTPAE